MISRRIFAAVALLCAFSCSAQAQPYTKAQLNTQVGVNFPDNNSFQIAPSNISTISNNIINSIMPTAPVVSGNLACFNGTTGLLQDCGVAPSANKIILGTTSITGGTSTRVLYDNGGFVGEYTNTQLTALINQVTSSLSGAMPAFPNTTTTFFRGDGTYAPLNLAAIGGTPSGNTSVFGTVSGALTSGDCVRIDANGNLVDSGAGCGSNSNTPHTQDFLAGTNFTAGTTIALTLSSAPTSTDLLVITFDGIGQNKNTWSLSGAVVTFNAAIPLNTQVVEAKWSTSSTLAGVGSIASPAGSLTIPTPNGVVTADVNTAHNFAWTGTHNFQGTVIFGGKPFFDVTSTANGCAAAALNGVTDDTAAIQCHVTYMNSTFGGGVVYFPPSSGCALVSGGGPTIPAGVWIVGSGLASSCIEVSTNSRAMLFAASGTTCPSGGHNGGIERISVFGFQNAAATQPAVLVGDNCAITIRDTRLWFGAYGLETSGADGHYEDSFICGYSGCVHSHGANWYRRVKMDTIIAGTAPSASGFAYVQDTNFVGLSVAENYFDQSDFTCGCAGSIDIADGGLNKAVTKFFNGVFDSPISIINADFTVMVGMTIGSTSFNNNAGTLLMSGSIAFGGSTAVGGAGAKSCAGNVGFSNC
jgi:hypothetical protein